MQPVVKAVLEGKLKGAQCSETVKSRVPTNDLYEKTKIFWSPKSKSWAPGATGLCQSTALPVFEKKKITTIWFIEEHCSLAVSQSIIDMRKQQRFPDTTTCFHKITS